MRTIEIMDTTLRDGEQTDGVSFSAFEKLQLTRFLLEKLGVDRVEIASARVSAGELDSMREVFAWAREKGQDHRIEILGFCDHRASVNWIKEAGGSVINLLTKGSQRHCELQLGKTLAEHLADIRATIHYADEQGVRVNVYLEDWSNGYLHSPDYVRELVGELQKLPVQRLLLPDTLGILAPEEVHAAIRDLLDRYPDLDVDFHGHNDYNLVVANCMAAIRAGVKGLHTSVNGLGERAGNAPLESVVTAVHDKLQLHTNIVEKEITTASRLVETFSGKRIQSNRPVVGQDVYTQTAGIHADGDKKNNLYVNPILPERFGRQRVYALGKLAGKASVENNLQMLGIELQPEREKRLLDRIKELGEQKKTVTADDLPFLIQDLFGTKGEVEVLKITDAEVTTRFGATPSAHVEIEYRGESYAGDADGDGGYDAFMNALRKLAIEIDLTIPRLVDYEVRIPPGGKTDALVEAVITWEIAAGERHFRTVGVDHDQVVAAIKATEKMLNRLMLPAKIFAGS